VLITQVPQVLNCLFIRRIENFWYSY